MTTKEQLTKKLQQLHKKYTERQRQKKEISKPEKDEIQFGLMQIESWTLLFEPHLLRANRDYRYKYLQISHIFITFPNGKQTKFVQGENPARIMNGYNKTILTLNEQLELVWTDTQEPLTQKSFFSYLEQELKRLHDKTNQDN